MRKIAELQVAKNPKWSYDYTSATELADLLKALTTVRQNAKVKTMASGNLGVYV